VLVFKVQPSEFWSMTVGEWWVLYDMHREQMGAIENKSGNRKMNKAELAELKRGLDEEIAKDRTNG